MEFKTSERVIKRRKNKIIYLILAVTIIMAFMSFSVLSKGDDILPLVFTFVVTYGILALFIFRNIIPDLKILSLLTLHIDSKAVCIDDGNTKHILSYDRIQNIEVKKRRKKIIKLIIKTKLNETYDYSQFEKLDEINSLLKRYLNEELEE